MHAPAPLPPPSGPAQRGEAAWLARPERRDSPLPGGAAAGAAGPRAPPSPGRHLGKRLRKCLRRKGGTAAPSRGRRGRPREAPREGRRETESGKKARRKPGQRLPPLAQTTNSSHLGGGRAGGGGGKGRGEERARRRLGNGVSPQGKAGGRGDGENYFSQGRAGVAWSTWEAPSEHEGRGEEIYPRSGERTGSWQAFWLRPLRAAQPMRARHLVSRASDSECTFASGK